MISLAVFSNEIFSDWHWGRCLELITHLCHYGDQVLVVYGPCGIGKTTMMQLLQQQEVDHFNFVVFDASSLLTADVLAKQIALIENEKSTVILVDDAQL